MVTLQPLSLGKDSRLNFHDFLEVVFHKMPVVLAQESVARLKETRLFIDRILHQGVKVYGLTTGFANLRNTTIAKENAALLSANLIRSHDGGIGPLMPKEVVRGAMLLRANSLAKGYSGISVEALQTLLEMLNHDIIPEVPCTGSLGASGDLASLARLGRAMMGDPVAVHCAGERCLAPDALKRYRIAPFRPLAKEGLALTNGTSYMTSMLALAYQREKELMETMMALQALFLNCTAAHNAPFSASIHQVRGQKGQTAVAKVLAGYLKDSPFVDTKKVQDDYCIRCLPQIFGPKFELIWAQENGIAQELDAVTDNPLIFKNGEILDAIGREHQIEIDGTSWAVLSGGNFHGENLATSADALCLANSKIALTLERQISYIMNPDRNKGAAPMYLIFNEEQKGLLSGFMIAQYTANALAQKICQLGHPVSVVNITSANESEDIVSYGASAGQKILEQQALFQQLLTVYASVMLQAYAIARTKFPQVSPSLPSEHLFHTLQEGVGHIFPIKEDLAFDYYPAVENALKRIGSTWCNFSG